MSKAIEKALNEYLNEFNKFNKSLSSAKDEKNKTDDIRRLLEK